MEWRPYNEGYCNWLKTSTENADQIKLKYGHAFYDTASEEEMFTVPIMGSDQTEQYSQLELSDIIEARVEIFNVCSR